MTNKENIIMAVITAIIIIVFIMVFGSFDNSITVIGASVRG